MKVDLTKRKFLSLSKERQNRKCAEILRNAYEEISHERFGEGTLESYHQMVEWLQQPKLESISLKAIADRYHHHLQEALIKHKEHNLLPLIRRGDRSTAEKPWSIAVYFDHIRSGHNVGSMLRTIEAFSLGKAYFSKSTPRVDNKQVKDASMGGAEWVDCHYDLSLEELPRPIIALETSPSAVPLFEFFFPESFTLVVGNEEYGCSDETLHVADILVEIPMRGRKNSLNVANAFSIAAAEIYRQKWSNQGITWKTKL